MAESTVATLETAVAESAGITLHRQFADLFPDMSVPWQAFPAPDPELVALNIELACSLGLDPNFLRTERGTRFLIGNELPEHARPVAQVYAGHQFGGYSPRLGDGRALLIGELETPSGALVDVHLKGSGRTPFARADGFAAIGPMLREFVVSEAMHALGVPTTRALAVTLTGGRVRRETLLPGAILTRIAASHLRVGSFEWAVSVGRRELLQRLADHAVDRHVPDARTSVTPYLELFQHVIRVQAKLIAHWMSLGFIHGVMNTDNMTISGETIDYGPCAFMETIDPAAVFSSIDDFGRYAYGQQPAIARWNLERLGEALTPLLAETTEAGRGIANAALETFDGEYRAAYAARMRAKLGFPAGAGDETVLDLSEALLKLGEHAQADFTLLFRALTEPANGIASVLGDTPEVRNWIERWESAAPDGGPDRAAMERANPIYIPRNRIVDEALEAATRGNFEPFESLLEAVTDPYRRREGLEWYEQPDSDGLQWYRTFCGT